MRDQYFRTGEGMLAVFSLSSRSSIEDLLADIFLFLRIKDFPKLPLVIVGVFRKILKNFLKV